MVRLPPTLGKRSTHDLPKAGKKQAVASTRDPVPTTGPSTTGRADLAHLANDRHLPSQGPSGGVSLLSARVESGKGARGGKSTEETPRERARRVIDEIRPPPSGHPYARHVAMVRAALAEKGLPTNAEGVPVFVLEANEDHGAMVTRSVAGPVGLARRVDVRLDLTPHEAVPGRTPLTEEQSARMTRIGQLEGAVKEGKATADDLIELGVLLAERAVHVKRQRLAATVAQLPGDGRTSLANMSFGWSIGQLGGMIATLAQRHAPEGSPLRTALEAKLGNLEFYSLAKHLCAEIEKRIEDPQRGAGLDEAVKNLEEELADARHRGLLVFTSAGNYRTFARDRGGERLAAQIAGRARGMIVVGAVDIKDPNRPDDDEMGSFSAGGAVTISAPGVDMPVAEKWEGFEGKQALSVKIRNWLLDLVTKMGISIPPML